MLCNHFAPSGLAGSNLQYKALSGLVRMTEDAILIDEVSNCRAGEFSDPLDHELARRLNLLASPAGADADSSGPIRPILIESAFWLAFGISIWGGALVVLT